MRSSSSGLVLAERVHWVHRSLGSVSRQLLNQMHSVQRKRKLVMGVIDYSIFGLRVDLEKGPPLLCSVFCYPLANFQCCKRRGVNAFSKSQVTGCFAHLLQLPIAAAMLDSLCVKEWGAVGLVELLRAAGGFV